MLAFLVESLELGTREKQWTVCCLIAYSLSTVLQMYMYSSRVRRLNKNLGDVKPFKLLSFVLYDDLSAASLGTSHEQCLFYDT